MGSELEGWGVYVRSDDQLFGPGTLMLGDGVLELEAAALDVEKHRQARRVRLWLFGISIVLLVATLFIGDAAAGLAAVAIVPALAGLLYGMRRWYPGKAASRRWSLAELSEPQLCDDSDGQIFMVFVFGIFGLLLGNVVPRRYLRFETGDAETGFTEWIIDLGSTQQFVDVASKLRSMEDTAEVSLI